MGNMPTLANAFEEAVMGSPVPINHFLKNKKIRKKLETAKWKKVQLTGYHHKPIYYGATIFYEIYYWGTNFLTTICSVGEAMASSYKSIFMGGPVAGGIHPPLKIFFPFYPENSLKSLNIAEKTKKNQTSTLWLL